MTDRDKLLEVEGVLAAMVLDLNALHSSLNQYLRGLTPAPTPTPAPSPTPAPTPAPVPTPTPPPAKLDYSGYHGETRGSIELAVREGFILPPGWNWEDAFASGHVKDVGSIPLPGGSSAEPGSDLGWSNGNPVVLTEARVLTVTPSAAWLASPGRSLTIKGGYTSRGTTPPWVSYTIHGRTAEFQGSNQNWSTGHPNFPPISGPFEVAVAMLDANRQPVAAGHAIAVELQHTP